jgi:hypothetical protein
MILNEIFKQVTGFSIEEGIRKCPQCDGVIKSKWHKYCSRFCGYKALRKPRPNCLICGKEVRKQVNRMCSISCSNRWKYRIPENRPHWNGGRKNWITNIRNKNWRPLLQWRWAVFTRDGFKCVSCGITKVPLEADHIMPYSLFPELGYKELGKPGGTKVATIGAPEDIQRPLTKLLEEKYPKLLPPSVERREGRVKSVGDMLPKKN